MQTRNSKNFRSFSWQYSHKTSTAAPDRRPVDILHDFYIPALRSSVRYDRVAGYFRSSSLAAASRGFSAFAADGGRMRLVACGYPKRGRPPLPVSQRGHRPLARQSERTGATVNPGIPFRTMTITETCRKVSLNSPPSRRAACGVSGRGQGREKFKTG